MATIKITCPSAGNCNQRVISANVNLITAAKKEEKEGRM